MKFIAPASALEEPPASRNQKPKPSSYDSNSELKKPGELLQHEASKRWCVNTTMQYPNVDETGGKQTAG